VDKINNSIGQDPDAISIIGVLDIYGFESFKVNRFTVSTFVTLHKCKCDINLFLNIAHLTVLSNCAST
jgi:hypothetical protein